MLADFFSFLKFTVMRMTLGLFENTATGLTHGDAECWVRPAARNLPKIRMHLVGGRGIDAVLSQSG